MLHFILLLFLNFVTFIKLTNLENETDSSKIRQRRAILTNNFQLWAEKVIPYFVDPRLNINLINFSLKNLNKETCLSFVQKSNPKEALFAYIPGCYYNTKLGKGSEIPHKIYLPINDLKNAIVVRATFRALGFDFEHNRDNRDKFVNINKFFIDRKFRHLFKKKSLKEAKTFNILYNYRSVMHFTSTEFAIMGKRTMTAKYIGETSTMGYTSKATFNDIKLLNMKFCTNLKVFYPNCNGRGYQHPKNHHMCKCLPFSYGNQCEMLPENNLPCSIRNSFIAFKDERSTVVDVGGKCAFFIKSHYGGKINLVLNFVEKVSNIYKCHQKNSVEVRYREDESVDGILFCPNGLPLLIQSKSDFIVILSNYETYESIYLRMFYREL